MRRMTTPSLTLSVILASLLAACGGGNRGDMKATETQVDAAVTKAVPSKSASASEAAGAAETAQTAAVDPPEQGSQRKEFLPLEGVYGDKEGPNANRNFFVYATCDGHLGIGAMWGDVAPWILDPTSETSFKEISSNQYNPPLEAQFELDADGNGKTLALNSHFKERGNMQRLSDLPEGWEPDCSKPAEH